MATRVLLHPRTAPRTASPAGFASVAVSPVAMRRERGFIVRNGELHVLTMRGLAGARGLLAALLLEAAVALVAVFALVLWFRMR